MHATQPNGDDAAVTAELAAVLERVNAALGDAIDALDQHGARYARTYALAVIHSPRRSALRPPKGMPTPVARLVRELVMDELRHPGGQA
jgi:hypothetical protein